MVPSAMAAGAQRPSTSGIGASDFVVDLGMLGTRQHWSVHPCRAPGCIMMLRWAWLSEKDVVLYMLRSRLLGAEGVVGPGEARTRGWRTFAIVNM